MAFNPFRGFRKQQKVIFAILTIICMLTFVLAGNFRGGDALDWIVGLFGGGKKGEVVATLYGNKVYLNELDQQRSQRRLANTFMVAALQLGSQATLNELRQEVLKRPPQEASRLDQRYYNEIRLAFLDGVLNPFRGGRDLEKNPVLKQLYPKVPNIRFFAQDDQRQLKRGRSPETQLRDLIDLRGQLLDKKMERQAQLIAGIIIMSQRAREISQLVPGMDFGFDGFASFGVTFFTPASGRQDLLDQRVWWHEADKLGIKLTDADVRAEVNRVSPVKDLLTGDSGRDLKEWGQFLQKNFKGADLPMLYKALANELRASIAEGIILGAEPGFRGQLRGAFEGPASVSPAEYVHFYDEQRTTLKVDLLAVPAEAFLAEVDRRLKDGKLTPPTEKQLQALFDTSKNVELVPGSSAPGFKEPHRVGLEWIALESPTPTSFQKVAWAFPGTGYLRAATDPREEYYFKRAEAILNPELKPKDAALFLGGAGLPLPMPTLAAPGPLGPLALAGAWPTLAPSFLRGRAYESLQTNFPVPLLAVDPALSYYTALNLPTVITSTAGVGASFGGSWLQGLDPVITSQMAAVVRGQKYQAEALKEERSKRARLVAQLTLASIAPALTRATTWSTAAEVKTYFGDFRSLVSPPLLSAYVNQKALRFQVDDEAASELAKLLRAKDVADLTKALKDAKQDPKVVAKVVAAALKRQPWLAHYVGRTDQPVDRNTIATSARYRLLLAGAGSSLTERLRAAEWPFASQPQPLALYTPTEQSGLLVWKTRDEPARQPATLAEVRTKVERAWRLQEARKLAVRAAEDIRDRVAGKKPEEALKILRGVLADHPSWGGLVRLDKVARQVPVQDEDAPGAVVQVKPTDYVAYKVPEEDVPHPPADLIDKLLGLKEHKAGVIADRPLDHYYVAYIEKRSAPPSPQEVLARTFPGSVSHAIEPNKLWKLAVRDKQKQFYEAVMKELRRQAGTLNAEGRFALNPSLKAEDNRNRNFAAEE